MPYGNYPFKFRMNLTEGMYFKHLRRWSIAVRFIESDALMSAETRSLPIGWCRRKIRLVTEFQYCYHVS
jgi:hypothetical protein